MKRIEKTVFISYRRTNGPWALAIWQNLTHSGFDVFLDYKNLHNGIFEFGILDNIRSRAHFLVLLTPSALEDCDTPGDWLRREIEEALRAQRNIVPLMLEEFTFKTPAITSKLTGTLAQLMRYNGLTVSLEYFDEAMNRLREQFLNVPVDVARHHGAPGTEEAARAARYYAAAAPPVQQNELTAQAWFERGFHAGAPDETIRCYTKAISLKPNWLDAYLNRAVVRDAISDHDGAQEDYIYAYRNRADARAAERDFNGAVKDYTKLLQLQPDDASVYRNRAGARFATNDFNGATEDLTELLRLQPNDAEAYRKRADARAATRDFDGAVEDLTELLRLQPNDVEAYRDRGLALQSKGDQKAARRDFDKFEVLKSQRDSLTEG